MFFVYWVYSIPASSCIHQIWHDEWLTLVCWREISWWCVFCSWHLTFSLHIKFIKSFVSFQNNPQFPGQTQRNQHTKHSAPDCHTPSFLFPTPTILAAHNMKPKTIRQSNEAVLTGHSWGHSKFSEVLLTDGLKEICNPLPKLKLFSYSLDL